MRRATKHVLSLRRKEANEQLLPMSKGREFQIVGAATEKLCSGFDFILFYLQVD